MGSLLFFEYVKLSVAMFLFHSHFPFVLETKYMIFEYQIHALYFCLKPN